METKLGEMEGRFAELIWARAPIPSGELARLCEKELQWKRTTMYTMLKRLIERGLFRNENGVVSVCVDREEFYAAQGAQVVESGFGGSLPRFVAAFASGGRLRENEIAELRTLIDSYDAEQETAAGEETNTGGKTGR